MGKRVVPKRPNRLLRHLSRMGFTNRLAIYILIFLAVGLSGGFLLACKSIETGYTGALACWTVGFTPLGTATSVALSRIVDKNKAENVGGNGDGITFASAKAKDFVQTDESVSKDSPPI